MFLVFVVEQVILHMLTSFLFVNGSGFEAKLSVKAAKNDFVVIFRANFARNRSVLRSSDQRF